MNKQTYTPIACSLYDELLAFASTKQVCLIIYKIKNREETITGYITDVYSEKKEEFLLVNKTNVIRLDHIISINGKASNSFKNTCFSS